MASRGRSFGADDDLVRVIGAAVLRSWCDVTGTVVAVEAIKLPTTMLDVVVDDETGRLRCCFLGRESIPAICVGRRLRVVGRVVRFRSRRCLLNPSYELVDAPGAASVTSS